MTPRQRAVAAFAGFDGALDVLNSVVKEARINTAWGPPIVIDSPFAPTPTGTRGAGAWMQPEIMLVLREGYGSPQSFAPYGKPGPSKWPIIVAGLSLLAAFTIFGGISFGKGFRR